MKKYHFLFMLCLLIIFVFGCEQAKPYHVVTVKSPVDGVFYTIETYAVQSLSPDTTQVYAHFEHAGKTTKRLVLAGEGEPSVAKIIWDEDDSHEVIFCFNGCYRIDTFKNRVDLVAGDASVTIHHSIKNCCNSNTCCESNGCCNMQ